MRLKNIKWLLHNNHMPLLMAFGAIDTLIGLHKSITHGSSKGGCVQIDDEGNSNAREISTLQGSIHTWCDSRTVVLNL